MPIIKPCFIGIDFDGTIVDHQYPDIGSPVPGAIPTMLELVKHGHRLILFTMRSGIYLTQAAEYVESNGVKLFGLNHNPEQDSWTTSPKAYAHFYVDDAAIGCPLIAYAHMDRLCVDWPETRKLMVQRNLLPELKLAA